MINFTRRPTRTTTALALGAFVCALALPLRSNAHPSLSQLSSELSHQQARQHSLAESIGSLSQTISELRRQIALVQSREAAVRAELAREEAELARIRAALARERRLVKILKARLARARMVLARQLVSNYEAAPPDLVGVVLEARGFADLLERIDFLRRAEALQQSVIRATRAAKEVAQAAERRLAKLEVAQAQTTAATATQARALAGMNALLQSKREALGRARAAQQSALAASRERGRSLQSAIARLQAQQAAARQAAVSATAPAAPALGPSGGWAIPYAIVLCESGGQNLPPNSAGASGYYQILPSTWTLFGGTGPAAYLAGKSEQDAVASRIWNGGAGASSWVCAGIVGIH